VLTARRALLDAQLKGFGGYENTGERTEALINSAFFARPQYYEVAYWKDDIAGQIAAYDGKWYAGRGGGPIWGALLVTLCGIGLIYLIPRWREDAVWLALIWLVVTAVGLYVSVPLEWQRYYLPLQAPLAVMSGAGAAGLKTWLAKNRRLER
jgi:hypothetical protein